MMRWQKQYGYPRKTHTNTYRGIFLRFDPDFLDNILFFMINKINNL